MPHFLVPWGSPETESRAGDRRDGVPGNCTLKGSSEGPRSDHLLHYLRVLQLPWGRGLQACPAAALGTPPEGKEAPPSVLHPNSGATSWVAGSFNGLLVATVGGASVVDPHWVVGGATHYRCSRGAEGGALVGVATVVGPYWTEFFGAGPRWVGSSGRGKYGGPSLGEAYSGRGDSCSRGAGGGAIVGRATAAVYYWIESL